MQVNISVRVHDLPCQHKPSDPWTFILALTEAMTGEPDATEIGVPEGQ